MDSAKPKVRPSGPVYRRRIKLLGVETTIIIDPSLEESIFAFVRDGKRHVFGEMGQFLRVEDWPKLELVKGEK